MAGFFATARDRRPRGRRTKEFTGQNYRTRRVAIAAPGLPTCVSLGARPDAWPVLCARRDRLMAKVRRLLDGVMAKIISTRDVNRAFVRGTGASLASLLALIGCSRRETGSGLAAVNAISHWAFGDDDARRDGFSWKHTITGALTQQAASVFWALVFERLLASRRRSPAIARLAGEAAAMSAVAMTVDYTITPRRLTPGYELRISKSSMLAVYVAFAAGLVAGSLLLPERDR